ncbi:acyl-CoA desaturase [Streptomyces sp. CA-181903]|uniref:acyl-CoA desaturase n=1 Tax=Streptomyces sp. CA-181903 TaxID=3240055 RepID=UPI003D8CB03B
MSTSVSPGMAHAIVRLDPVSLRTKRLAMLTTNILPALGTAAAGYLLATGDFTPTDLWLFGGMYLVHGFGVTVGYHRYAAHKAFRSGPVFEAVMMITGSMGAQGPLVWWVATHRRHHRFSDREGDPHSPNLHGGSLTERMRGLWYAHMPWMLSDEESRWTVFTPDLLGNRRLMYYHRTYMYWLVVGLAVPGLIGYAVEGTVKAAVTGVLFGGLARVFLANQATWMVTSVCHAVGSRPFRTDDRSANNWPVALLTLGEGLQNNHHAFPGSYRHGVTWFEPDPSGWLLALLGRLGVVTDLREPTKEQIARKRRRAAGPAAGPPAGTGRPV